MWIVGSGVVLLQLSLYMLCGHSSHVVLIGKNKLRQEYK